MKSIILSKFSGSPLSRPVFCRRLAAGVLLVNLFVIALVGLSLRQSWLQYEKLAGVSTQNLARLLEESIGSSIDKIDLVLLDLKSEIEGELAGAGVDGPATTASLIRHGASLPEVDGLWVAGKDGSIICGKGVVAGVRKSVADRNYFKRLQEEPQAGLTISRPFVGRITGKWVIAVARRLNRPDGSFAGAVFGVIPLDHFLKLFSSIDVGRHGSVTLRDGQLGIIARYPEPSGVGNTIGQNVLSSQFRALLAKGAVSGTYKALPPVDRIERTFSYRKIAGYPLYINVGLATSDYLGVWRGETAKMAVAVALFLILSLVVARLIYHDWLRRKAGVQALVEQEAKFHSLCDSAPVGIFQTDGRGELTYVNPCWEEITGVPAATGLGQEWVMPVHPEDRETIRTAWADTAIGEHLYFREFRLLTPEGKLKWVRMLANPMKSVEGTVTGYVGTLADITELRQAKQEMLKTGKLESLGVLAGGIAHDFNNILTAILGNLSLLRRQLGNPERATRRLDEAEKAVSRAQDLSRQLLTFARGGEPVKKIVALGSLLQEAAGFVTHGSTVRCEYSWPDDLWAVEADEGQLSQVIHNLVINAVQAMPDGGIVTISAENVDTPLGQRYVRIAVADTGTGIPESHLQKIFDPYFTTKQKGSGLGLATSYSIIRKHGGKLRAVSTLGKGSTFFISLPAATQQIKPQANAKSETARGRGRVLVMDDEDVVGEIAQAMLEELGYTVELVKDGAEAVELYRKRQEEATPFAAAIMDLTIPGGMGGKEAIKRLLDIDPAVKAIVSSGYFTDPVMADFREYGFSAVLSKPYRLEEMSSVLQELLNP